MTLKQTEELFSASLATRDDLFISGVSPPSFAEIAEVCRDCKTAVVLPAKLFSSKKEGVQVCRAGETAFDPSAKLIFAEASLFSGRAFFSFLERGGFRRILVPFAELCDECEYGSLRGYSEIGERRAETTAYMQLAALFSAGVPATEFEYAYSARRIIRFTANDIQKPRVIRCGDGAAVRSAVYREIRKQAGKTGLIFFPTRTAAKEFSAFCAARGFFVPVVTGESDGRALRSAAAAFLSGEINALAGTKSMLSLFPLIKADRVFVAGVPFSENHLYRMLSLGETGTVVYSPEDIGLAEKLIPEYCFDYRPDFAEEMLARKNAMLSDVLSFLGVNKM